MRSTRLVLATVVAISSVARAQQTGNDSTFKPKEYSVADLYKNIAFGGASWSPDSRKILIRSNASGIFNAYVVSISGGEPTALTHSTTNSIRPVSYFPNDERILYTSDEG